MTKHGPSYASVRSYILLIAGLAVIGWEAVVERGNASYPIIVSALLMMGITFPLRLDEQAQKIMAAAIHRAAPPPDPPPDPPPSNAPVTTEAS